MENFTRTKSGSECGNNSGIVDTGWATHGDRLEENKVLQGLYLTIAILGLMGNIVICVTVYRVPSLRTITNAFVTSLAAADIISCMFLIPLHLVPAVQIPPGGTGELICRLISSKYFLWTSFSASVFSLTMITLERYVALIYPLRYTMFFKAGRIAIIIALVWITAVIINTYMFYTYSYDHCASTCKLKWPDSSNQKFVGVGNFTLSYLFPCLIMAFCYISIMSSLKKSASSREGADLGGILNTAARSMYSARRKVIRMWFVVFVTFALCWAPCQVTLLFHNLGADVDFTSTYFNVTVLIASCNSFINPMIYAFQNKQFRKGVSKALCSCCKSGSLGNNNVIPFRGSSNLPNAYP